MGTYKKDCIIVIQTAESPWSHLLLPLPLLAAQAGQQRKERIKKPAQTSRGGLAHCQLAPSCLLLPLASGPRTLSLEAWASPNFPS